MSTIITTQLCVHVSILNSSKCYIYEGLLFCAGISGICRKRHSSRRVSYGRSHCKFNLSFYWVNTTRGCAMPWWQWTHLMWTDQNLLLNTELCFCAFYSVSLNQEIGLLDSIVMLQCYMVLSYWQPCWINKLINADSCSLDKLVPVTTAMRHPWIGDGGYDLQI
jgi:hypothetical protein